MDRNNSLRAGILKIAAEVVLGIIIAIAVGFILDRIITLFLPQYKAYESLINEGVTSVIVLIIGFLVSNTIIKHIEKAVTTTKTNMYGIALIIRVIIYIAIIAVVLSVFHVSVTGILAGSAIGGVVLGLAVQTVASNLLSGLFVSSSRTLKYGEVVNINSWVWSITTIGKVVEVKTLFSKILTKDGNIITIPNSTLLGSSVIVEYKDKNGFYNYPVDILMNADVPLDLVVENAKLGLGKTNIYVGSKNGMNNTVHAIVNFKDVSEINAAIDKVNRVLDEAYWSVKNNIAILGPYATALSGNKYRITATLSSDVGPAQIIKEAKKKGIKLYLVSKAATANTYVAEFRKKGTMEDNISKANMAIDKIYSDLKNRQSAKKKK
ncbi:MAG: mechanosensitive ion channel family protein [Candidatus Marsarchaeota archaeon]|nr:mechanosensitive ion channel family protein [Candidatus Marsarchaeota archaeon]